MIKLNKLLLAAILIVPQLALGTEVSPISPIKTMNTYSGSGTVFVKLVTNGSYCTNGYFLDPSNASTTTITVDGTTSTTTTTTNPGYDLNVSALLAAYYSGEPIRIYADDNTLWAGTNGTTCKINAVSVTN